MGRPKKQLKPLTPSQQKLLDESWDEVGSSIAASIVEAGRTKKWAWALIGPTGLYRKWMLDHWVERYLAEHPGVSQFESQPKRKPKSKKTVSVFTKREQINEALRMLGDGKNPLDYFRHDDYLNQNGGST